MGRRRGRGRGQGNRGRKSGRARGSVGGGSKGGAGSGKGKGSGSGSGKGKGKGKGRGGQGNRGKGFGRANSQSKNKGTSKGGTSTGKRGGQGNRSKGFGRAKGTVTGKSVKKSIKSVKKAVSNAAKGIGKGVRKAIRGAAAKAGTHVANSKYNKQLKKANWTKRDMTKLTPQQQRKYQRLSEKTGRDYSIRKPTFRLNLNADTIARFGKFADKGWYKGLTNRFPGIKTLKINKQFYGNPMKKGWHSSQRTGRGHGVDLRANSEQQLRNLYQEVLGREADQEGLNYWQNELQSGNQNLDQIRNQFLQSDEYKQTQGGDPMLPPVLGSAIGAAPGFSFLPPIPRGPRGGGRPPRGGFLPIMPTPGIPGFGGRRPDPDGYTLPWLPGRPRPPQVRNPELGNDWLGRFYDQYNIGGPEGLTKEARDYWTNEAKTKGIQQTMDIIEGTARANNTWGGRAKGLVDPGEDYWRKRGIRRTGGKKYRPPRRKLTTSEAAIRRSKRRLERERGRGVGKGRRIGNDTGPPRVVGRPWEGPAKGRPKGGSRKGSGPKYDFGPYNPDKYRGVTKPPKTPMGPGRGQQRKRPPRQGKRIGRGRLGNIAKAVGLRGG